MDVQKSLTVSEFLLVVNELLGGADAIVEGEISQFSVSHGKWVFFTLKDQEAEAVVECFMMAFALSTPLENGMLVRVTGKPGVHLRSGRFRISVTRVEPVGEGALARALALLKEKLAKEGLFAADRKRALPLAPERIGLIASRDSAAYSDFLKILKHRFGGVVILFYHVQVEGPAALNDILAAFDTLSHQTPRPEAIVLTRGGGSLESLAAFNAEPLARAIYACPVPVVVGVGHERDITIADLVADVRASTPSNAAELLMPDRHALLEQLKSNWSRLSQGLNQIILDEAQLLARFDRAASHSLERGRERTLALWGRLSHSVEVRLQQERPQEMAERLLRSLRETYLLARQSVVRSQNLLISLNPSAVLKRGYSIVRRRVNQATVRQAADVRTGDELDITLGNGKIGAIVD